jgi:Mor family transcriptional regulator
MYANKVKRNRAIKEEFAARCEQATTEYTTPNKSFIYADLGKKYNLSAVQVRHIVKGYAFRMA